MKQVKTDPRICCPIVCGEYMRATGFFFSYNGTTYLVTARHNLLPTNGSEIASGEINSSWETEHSLPCVDVFLRTEDRFDVERIDIREIDGVVQTPEIDVIAIPFRHDVENYRYHVWKESELSSPANETESLDIIGFNGDCFPQKHHTYQLGEYRTETTGPVRLPSTNEKSSSHEDTGVVEVAIDEEFVGEIGEYNGLSGSPVLGDGLVGVHMMNWLAPQQARRQFDDSEFMHIMYTRTDLLPKLVSE